jgi:gliding motility-associated-like protein
MVTKIIHIVVLVSLICINTTHIFGQSLDSVTFQSLPVTCHGNDGEVVFSDSHFQYSWSDGSDATVRIDLKQGDYTVTVSDASDSSQLRIFYLTIGNSCDCSNFIKTNYIVKQAVSCNGLTPISLDVDNNSIVNVIDNGIVYANGVSGDTKSTTLFLEAYDHVLYFVHEYGCLDTLVVSIACTTTDTLNFDMVVGEKKKVSFKSNELWGSHIQYQKGISPEKELLKFNATEIEGNFEMTALNAGRADYYWLAIDEFGIADTFLIHITVSPSFQAGSGHAAYISSAKITPISLDEQEDKKADLTVFTAFSPNDDNINDYFTIKNVEQYPHNNLTIRDAAGSLVYHADSYSNNWSGTMNNTQLPTGTYYYFLNDGLGKTHTGFLQLQR